MILEAEGGERVNAAVHRHLYKLSFKFPTPPRSRLIIYSIENFFLPNAASPINPEPRSNMVAGPEMIIMISQEAVSRLLFEKGIFTKREFLKMVEKVNREMARMV